MASIQLDRISVSFPVYTSRGRSLKTQLLDAAIGGYIRRAPGRNRNGTLVEALREVSLRLKDGDRVGLIGHNGAGKSTLLRVMAGIYEPNSGKLSIQGHAVPLLSKDLGMDPESTGYENIIRRGLYLGLTKRQVQAQIEEIADFTELGEFLDLPVHTYSDGMRMRLAFAVSTAVSPDILLLDEGIGAGDAAFLKKADERLKAFTERVSIIVLSSHSKALITKICSHALLLQQGKVVDYGEAEAVFTRYQEMSNRTP